ncbi:glutathione S-transferase T3-like [Chenopodium quinoa]|uniref:glutathione S-transferase T3-like n=1 Tax=Chenopodium quinoa TaxID=63459 RepID=UPI000B78358E|nr:glutathione S-transferase T3-like [Chenopodium quinoa]
MEDCDAIMRMTWESLFPGTDYDGWKHQFDAASLEFNDRLLREAQEEEEEDSSDSNEGNTQFDESEEESVPETPQYPPAVPRLESNQVAARATRIWSVAEDETLIRLFMEISENAIKGTSQKATSLWRDVHAAYQMAHAEKPHILPPRPMKRLTSHWRRLAADTLQWISCYDEAGRLPEGGSGYNEADRIKCASKLFHLA